MSGSNTFTLDGKDIPFEDGDTIMDAALRAGEYIPHLCHNPEFPPHGSCRVCVVNANGRQISACTQPAVENMEVDNSSDEIMDQRRALLQMLFVEGNHVCPRCEGHGFIRGVESLALSILRVIEEHAMKENTGRVTAQLPVDVATFLLNEKRQAIHDIEKRQEIEVVLVPNPHMETPHYTIDRVRLSDLPRSREEQSSYQMVQKPEARVPESRAVQQAKIEQPAVRQIAPPQPAPALHPTLSYASRWV